MAAIVSGVAGVEEHEWGVARMSRERWGWISKPLLCDNYRVSRAVCLVVVFYRIDSCVARRCNLLVRGRKTGSVGLVCHSSE